jgi:hypothetical protein
MTALALGCSHTAGVGVDADACYVSVLSGLTGVPIRNLGVPGGNATHVQSQLVQALTHTLRPDFVVAQWPNPFRRTIWHNSTALNENIQNASPAFQQLLRQGEKNFYQPWVDAIVVCNILCRTAGVPVINIMIEDVPQEYHDQLANQKIVLHVDKKLPDQTWLMDSSASDLLHHSAVCHQQWAQRLHGLLNELTTP